LLDNTLSEVHTNEENDSTIIKVSKVPSFIYSIKEALLYISISLAIILGTKIFVVQHVRVEGTSMTPTLVDDQHLLIEKISYRFKDIERFDIVVFRPYYNEKNIFYVKRVIGLPGETVQIKDNTIFIDGKPLKENYSEDYYTDGKMAMSEMKLGDNDYFVLGDNRNDSKDSRNVTFGLVHKDEIDGLVMIKIWPINDVGKI
jgi:signal peptidase I